MRQRAISILNAALMGEFGRRAISFTLLTAIDRALSLGQTIVIARMLGITEYGVYGMLFVSIGIAVAVVGLHMGMTASVFVARYRIGEKSRAANLIAAVERFSWISCAVFFVGVVPFSTILSAQLLGSTAYLWAVILGTLLVGTGVICGVQDGIAQGFEKFGALGKAKCAVSSITLGLVFILATKYGLPGVLAAILAGESIKYFLLRLIVQRARLDANIPAIGTPSALRNILTQFSLPASLVSLALGFASWIGMFVLSRQHAGFHDVAIVNAGLQWRGPVLLMAGSVGAVAVPAFSRLNRTEGHRAVSKLRNRLLLLNLGVSAAVASVLCLASSWILGLYGAPFAAGQLTFCLIVLSTIPIVTANVYGHELIGRNRMWRQLWLHVPYLAAMTIGMLILVPEQRAQGYAYALLLGATVYLAHAHVMSWRGRLETH